MPTLTQKEIPTELLERTTLQTSKLVQTLFWIWQFLSTFVAFVNTDTQVGMLEVSQERNAFKVTMIH